MQLIQSLGRSIDRHYEPKSPSVADIKIHSDARDSCRDRFTNSAKTIRECLQMGIESVCDDDPTFKNIMSAFKAGDDAELGKLIRELSANYLESLVDLFYDEDL